MVDTGIFATTAEVQYKAGANASTTANVETYINSYVSQAESYINAVTRKNWSDAYTSLNVDVKGLLKEAASNIAAMYVIAFDPSGFSSVGEAQFICNVLWDRASLCIEELKRQEVKGFIEGA